MTGALRRNGHEILDALDDAVIKLKRALKERSETQSEHIRRTTSDNRDFDGSHTDSDPGTGPGDHHGPAGNGGRGNGNGSDVQELETGSYSGLRSRERRGDGTQHDHIPSKAALLRAAERMGIRLSHDQRRAIANEGQAIEISDALHRLSRTYGGRQNRMFDQGNGNRQSQVDLDASDLDQAMWRDLATLWENVGNTRSDLDKNEVLDAIQEVIDRNGSIRQRLKDILDDND